MAVLKSYYWLCALPGSSGRNPLGASPDGKDSSSGGGLLTLGPHLLARYTFAGQKQIGGWTCKDFITAPATYDRNEKSYVCAFNDNTVKVWDESTENLDRVKKIKFSRPIVKLADDGDGGVVLMFKDGGCASLARAIAAKKSLETVDILEKDETIENCGIFRWNGDKYACYVTKAPDGRRVLARRLEVDANSTSTDSLKRVAIRRTDSPDARAIGYSLSFKTDEPRVHVMWSDGRLFGIDPIGGDTVYIGNVPYINCDVDASTVWIGDDHLAIYGADTAREGAILILFNVSFGVVSYRYPLKMHCPGARVWCLPDNLILESHQHLAVVPYVLSSHRNALSLIGSHKDDKEIREVANADWGAGTISWDSNETWNEPATKGVSERDVCFRYFPALMKNDNVEEIEKAIEKFTDIPEDVMIDLLSYSIKKFDLKRDDGVEKYRQLLRKKSNFKQMMNSVLNLPFVRENMIPCLRLNFDINNTIVLLKYLNFLLCDNYEETNISMKFEENLILWSSCLIDSHFQEILLAKDPKHREVLEMFLNTVKDLIDGIEQIQTVLPLFQSFNGTNVEENISIDDVSYYLEDVKLF